MEPGRLRLATLAALGAFLVGTAVAFAGAAAAAAPARLSIVDFAFSPAAVSVPAGATVTWTNSGQSPHTVTSDNGAFDSSPGCTYATGCLNPGNAFSHTFTAPGTYTYHCRVHTTMHGTVTVTPGAPPTTAPPATPPPTATPPPSTPPATTPPRGMSPPPSATSPAPSATALPAARPGTPGPTPASTIVPPPSAGVETPTTKLATATGALPSTVSSPTPLSASAAAHHRSSAGTGLVVGVLVAIVLGAVGGTGFLLRRRGSRA
jgi:plastocyanin